MLRTYDLAVWLVRLFVLVAALEQINPFLQSLVLRFSISSASFGAEYYLMSIAPHILKFAFLVMLWLFSGGIAELVTGTSRHNSPTPQGASLMPLGCSLVGLSLVTNTVNTWLQVAVSLSIAFYSSPSSIVRSLGGNFASYAFLFAATLGGVIGIVLMVVGRGWLQKQSVSEPGVPTA